MPGNKTIGGALVERLPYRLREPFLPSRERALFRVLQELVGDRYVVCPKVSLDDVFLIVRPNENVHFFNKIFRKHVDFLLCDPNTMSPAFGVELVKPVAKTETRAVDRFMEDIFVSAGLPLVHIPTSDHYDPSDIVHLFQLALAKVGGTSSLRIEGAGDSVPMCPVCGKMMVLRIHRGGPNAGKEYYGCMDNPRCKGMVQIDLR